MVTMLGWFKTPAARDSFWKRRTISWASSPWTSRRIVLRATVRPMVGSVALYTTPMAPRPSSPLISYLPTVWRDIIGGYCLVTLWHPCFAWGGNGYTVSAIYWEDRTQV